MKINNNYSFAKINLFLKIINQRDDGYHDLESVMCYIDLKDKIEYIQGSPSQNPTIRLNISGDFSSRILVDENIFIKIFDYFVREYKVKRNIDINLEKNIPVAAGLGGGSSNGSSFIKFLNQEFNLSLKKHDLQNIALKFGCDLPFFFEKNSKIIRSKGEVMEDYKDFKDQEILLVNPNIEVATADIFRSNKFLNAPVLDSSQIRSLDIVDLIKDLPNDLQKVAIKKFPIINFLIYELRNLDANAVKMTGSGPTCFAIFKNKSALDLAYEKILAKFPNFFAIKTKIISKIQDA